MRDSERSRLLLSRKYINRQPIIFA